MKAAAVGLLVIAWAGQSWAADANAPSTPAVQRDCLKLAPGAPAGPVYPQELYEAKVRGRIELVLEFPGPDAEPNIQSAATRTLSEPEWVLFEAAAKFARHYRFTCMKAGDAPVRVQRNFNFVPTDGRPVTWTVPPASPAGQVLPRNASHPCLVKGPDPKMVPRFGAASPHSDRVVITYEFKQFHEPPETQVLVPAADPHFTRAMLQHVGQYKVVCGMPNFRGVAMWELVNSADRERYALRDSKLVPFLAATRNARQKPVSFDLDRMGCPFDVRVQYWQPFLGNAVGEIGAPVPERRPFLEWLAGLQLELNDKLASRVAGDEFTLAVPCGKIDL